MAWFDASLATSQALGAFLAISGSCMISQNGNKKAGGGERRLLETSALRLFLALGSVIFLLRSQTRSSDGFGPATTRWPVWALVSSSSVVVPLYVLLMSQLPHSFTLGEGAVISQGIALLIASASIDWLLPSKPDKQECEVGRFIIQVCFWILALAFFAWNALRRPLGNEMAVAKKRGDKESLSQGLLTDSARCDGAKMVHGEAWPLSAERLSDVGALTEECRGVRRRNWRPDDGRKRKASSLARRSGSQRGSAGAPVSAETPVRPASRGAMPSIGLRIRTGISLLGGGVAAMALFRQAYWVLALFIPRRPGVRLAALAYWIALVGGTVPLLYEVQRAGTVPHILMRKGYHILALALFVPILFMDASMMQVMG